MCWSIAVPSLCHSRVLLRLATCALLRQKQPVVLRRAEVPDTQTHPPTCDAEWSEDSRCIFIHCTEPIRAAALTCRCLSMLLPPVGCGTAPRQVCAASQSAPHAPTRAVLPAAACHQTCTGSPPAAAQDGARNACQQDCVVSNMCGNTLGSLRHTKETHWSSWGVGVCREQRVGHARCRHCSSCHCETRRI